MSLPHSWGGLLLLGLVSGLWPVAATVAHARSGTCVSLERRLASLSSAAPSSRYARYDEAIREQERQIDSAHRMAWRLGCSGGLLFSSGPSEQCDALDIKLDRMQANLINLQRTRDRLGRSGQVAQRRRLEAALDAHGCNGQEASAVSPERDQMPDGRRTSLGNQWFPDNTADTSESDDEETVGSGVISILPEIPPGKYRTLCVRTCDGYYFPISFGATPSDFMRDQNACQARCPGAKVELYFTRPDQEPEKMVSLTGEPYTALPTAFKYRKAGVARSCSCHVQTRTNPNYSVLGDGSAPAPTDGDGSSTVAVPAPRPGAPDILVQKPSAPAEHTTAKAVNSAPDRPKSDDDETKRRIRVVGPKFLPDPLKAIDLRDPDRKNDR